MTPDFEKFARMLFDENCWPDFDIDYGWFQDAAIECGLLIPEERTVPCGEACQCAEFYDGTEFAEGITCYRKHPLLIKEGKS